MAWAQDMQDFDAASNQGVGDQPPVAAPGDRFGAQDGGRGAGGAANQPLQGGAERRGLHVIGVAPKGLDPPGGVGGVGTGGAPAPEVRLMDVFDASRRERGGQGIARELRMAAGSGVAPDVDEDPDPVFRQQRKELFDGTG